MTVKVKPREKEQKHNQKESKIVSRRNPEDIQELVIWKRYSDFKKLHKDLWQIHKNLCRQTELFPPFAKGKVFGRFDETVIEERRQCAEDLLQFSASIPALFSSQHFEEFFKGGELQDGSELIGPPDPVSDSQLDNVSICSTEVYGESSQLDDVGLNSVSEYGGFSSDSDLISLTVDTDSFAEVDDGMAFRRDSPNKILGLSPSQDPSARVPLVSQCETSKNGGDSSSRSLFPVSLKSKLGKPDYLEKAGELIKLAVQRETEQDYEAAFGFYKRGVDLLLEGVQGESNSTRREAVKKKTAEYLMRAEQISTEHLKNSSEAGIINLGPPGPLSSRPSWNLRSPAEELKAFRVLGVIDKVLLVTDTRTQETFILKGLRKSSEYSRNRKTIIPRCVPNMVHLHKYIISEESIFLVLQHAEGGKLWSYLSRFFNRSMEESFNVPETQHFDSIECLHIEQLNMGGSSIDSEASHCGKAHEVLPLKTSLTPSSQDDSSTQEDGQDNSHVHLDSGSTSDEECTTSYLTLCKEYEQETFEPDSLPELPSLHSEVDITSSKEIEDNMQVHSTVSIDSLISPFTSQEINFFCEDTEHEIASPTQMSDSLTKFKNSPMEFFRIDSKDSTGDLGQELGEKLYNMKTETQKLLPFLTDHDSSDDQTSLEVQTVKFSKNISPHDTLSKSSSDSVPVISFQDAAGDAISCDEGRPDLLVNLPGVSEVAEVNELIPSGTFINKEADLSDSKLFEAPDVLQWNHGINQTSTFQGSIADDVLLLNSTPDSFSKVQQLSKARAAELFETMVDRSSDLCIAETASNIDSDTVNTVNTVGYSSQGPETAFAALQSAVTAPEVLKISTAKELHLEKESTFFHQGNENNESKNNKTLLLADEVYCTGKMQIIEGEDQRPVEGRLEDREVSRIFKELDESLALVSQAHIPESCIRRWAAEMVAALDALHREGIVCRDLNPNNILLNDRGHIQLTYFSRWSEVEDSCDSSAIERMYCAPEVESIVEETEACDWWSLGAILFELLTGKSLFQCHPAGINSHTSLNIPDYVSEEAKSLVQQLLQFNSVERLGAGAGGVEDIKSHPFFSKVDWAALAR
ncbi:ribosomal protein S6 kinase delta-1 isoform X2 [Protopterus annectens]|uniref:ribosomal protein S6 kinase delta-1 isoform X2 n=1 Tax=Protopterus annectens TaxID=7888 RepID=UPI001CFC44F5|nr:ribosomal protein S6 kinase delta-1 isoform X2 [Protopterus annectens]